MCCRTIFGIDLHHVHSKSEISWLDFWRSHVPRGASSDRPCNDNDFESRVSSPTLM
jgi:hypothetical protein